MRMIRFALLGIFCLSLPAASAHAAGNVLLPSTGNSSSASSPPPPSLGLIPVEPAPADAKPSAAGSESKESAPPAATTGSVAAPPALSSAKPLTAYSPAPPAARSSGGTPTQVVQIPKPPQMSDPALGTLPGSLSINIPDKYVWGPQDIENIGRRLGLGPDQISAHCHLSANGMALTDKGLYTFDTGYSPHGDLAYDGKISSFSVRLAALCDMLPLPPNAGYIIQVNDKYSIPLRQVTCPPPPPGAHGVVVHYLGNGNGQCELQ